MNRSKIKKIIDNDLRSRNGYVTYVVLDKFGFFKVGRSKDINSRLRQIETANIHIVAHKIINFDCENEIHNFLSHFRYKNEWFTFIKDYEDIQAPVFDFLNYTYFNILLLTTMIKKYGIDEGKKYFAEINFNRFKHIYLKS